MAVGQVTETALALPLHELLAITNATPVQLNSALADAAVTIYTCIAPEGGIAHILVVALSDQLLADAGGDHASDPAP